MLCLIILLTTTPTSIYNLNNYDDYDYDYRHHQPLVAFHERYFFFANLKKTIASIFTTTSSIIKRKIQGI